MALFTGNIKDRLIKNGRRFIQFVGMGRDDVKEHRAVAPWGDESMPVDGAVAIYGSTSVNGESVVLGYINQIAVDGMNPGERRLFSTDADGVEQIYIKLTDAGKIELGGNADNLVRYTDLYNAFEELRTDLNSLITSYNAHVHFGVTAGVASTGTTATTATPSSADMSGAKIDELECSA